MLPKKPETLDDVLDLIAMLLLEEVGKYRLEVETREVPTNVS